MPCGRGLGCLHPHAVHNPRDQAPYWLFYTPYPPDEAELPYLARSTDGVRFHCRGVHNPLLERGEYGSWDSHHLADIDVIRVGGTWYMYYAGASWVRGTKRVAIGLALSDDGMVWRKVSRPVLEPSRDHWWEVGLAKYRAVLSPTALAIRGDIYMYYEAVDGHGVSHIALASSRDGLEFDRIGVVMSPILPWERRGVSHPFVTRLGRSLIMLYVGYDGERFRLGAAVGGVDDLTEFERYEEPLLPVRESLVAAMARVPLAQRITSLVIRLAVREGLRRLTDLTLPSPTWDSWHAYRSSLLSTPERELVIDECGIATLYVSAYDAITLIPSIGVYELTIDVG